MKSRSVLMIFTILHFSQGSWTQKNIYFQKNGQKHYLSAPSWKDETLVTTTTEEGYASGTSLLPTSFKQLIFTAYNPGGNSFQLCATNALVDKMAIISTSSTACFSDFKVENHNTINYLKQGSNYVCLEDGSDTVVKYQQHQCAYNFLYDGMPNAGGVDSFISSSLSIDSLHQESTNIPQPAPSTAVIANQLTQSLFSVDSSSSVQEENFVTSNPLRVESSTIPEITNKQSTQGLFSAHSSAQDANFVTSNPLHIESSTIPENTNKQSTQVVVLESSSVQDANSVTSNPLHIESSAIPENTNKQSTQVVVLKSSSVQDANSVTSNPLRVESSTIPENTNKQTTQVVVLKSSSVQDANSVTINPLRVESSTIPEITNKQSTQGLFSAHSSAQEANPVTSKPLQIESSTTTEITKKQTTPVVVLESSLAANLKTTNIQQQLVQSSNTAHLQQLNSTTTTKPNQMAKSLQLEASIVTNTLSPMMTDITYSSTSLANDVVVTSISPTKSVLVQATSSSVVAFKPDFYRVIGPWIEYRCPVQCKRSTTERKRKCGTDWKYFEAPDDSICAVDVVRNVDCLDLSDCTGTRQYLATEGMSCAEYCGLSGLQCTNPIQTGNIPDVFNNVILPFEIDVINSKWQHAYGPYCRNGTCAEYVDVPDIVDCNVKPDSNETRRLCYCQDQGDKGYGDWSPWSTCSATCQGIQSRSRECLDYCHGDSTETKSCEETQCPVHGGFSNWTFWSNCSETCGGGKRSKTRQCDSPTPQAGGNDCIVDLIMIEECNVHYCPVDASWGEWTFWSGCDKPCNNGSYVRKRYCSKALYGGVISCGDTGGASADAGYERVDIENRPCNNFFCHKTFATLQLPIDGKFTDALRDSSSREFQNLQNELLYEFNMTFNDVFRRFGVIEDLTLNNARHGSIIANCTIIFSSFDSFQFIVVQDSIEVDKSIGKIRLLDGATILSVGPKVPTEPPYSIQASSPSPTTLLVSWIMSNATNYNVTGYIVFYRSKLTTSADYQRQASERTQTNITGLQPGTVYVVRVLAYTREGNGIASKGLEYSTQEMLPDLAPTSLEATSYTPTTIYIEWNAVPRESMNGEPLGNVIDTFANGTLLQRNTTSTYMENFFTSDGLQPNRLYVLEVCALNRLGLGPCDRTSATTMHSPPTAPPTDFNISEYKTHNSLKFSWSPPPSASINGDLTAYKLMWTNKRTNTIRRVTVHPTLTSYRVSGLSENTGYEFEILAANQYGDGVVTGIYGETCKCPEKVTSSFYLLPPYTLQTTSGADGIFLDILKDMIPAICGQCKRESGVTETTIDSKHNGRDNFAQKNLEIQAIQEIDAYTDVTFPVIATQYLDTFLNYPYIEVLEYPGAVVIAKDKSWNVVVNEMVLAILNVWPLIVINTLIMIVAGFFVWLLDGRMHRQGDFSSKVFQGLQEGWYWAFITQGTHGYGDFIPKLVISRMAAVLYIFIGLVLSSLMVGAIVTAITTVNDASEFQKIYGSKIGAMNSSFEERIGLLRNGKVNQEKQYTTIKELQEALLSGQVEGVILDAYTAGSEGSLFRHPEMRAVDVLYYPRVYGIVLSGQLANLASEARDYVSANQQQIMDLVVRKTTRMEATEKQPMKSIFTEDSEIYQVSIVTLIVLLQLAVMCGVAYQCWRGRRRRRVSTITTRERWQLWKIQRGWRKQQIEDAKTTVEDFYVNIKLKMSELQEQHAEAVLKLRKRSSKFQRITQMLKTTTASLSLPIPALSLPIPERSRSYSESLTLVQEFPSQSSVGSPDHQCCVDYSSERYSTPDSLEIITLYSEQSLTNLRHDEDVLVNQIK